MTNIELMEKALPTAPLKIAALESCKDLAEKVDQYIVSFRKNSLHDFLDPAIYSSYEADSYLAKNSCPRFGSGEAKGIIRESSNPAEKDLFYYGGCLQLQPDIHSKRTYQSHVTG